MLLSNAKLYALETNTDSLQNLINNLPNDTNKVKYMFEIIDWYQTQLKEKAIDIGFQAFNLSKTINWPTGKAISYIKIGRSYCKLANTTLHCTFILELLINLTN